MKTTQKMLLSLATLTALSTVGYATCATHVDMGNHRIVNVSDPVDAKDVVNKRSLEAYTNEKFKKIYIRNDADETVLNLGTNLMWQDNADVADVTKKKQWLTTANYNDCTSNGNNCLNTFGDTATSYCDGLTLGGYTDWRLPTKEELYGIVSGTTAPTISTVFQHVVSNNYWSSTNYAGNSLTAWFVRFSNGYQNGGFKIYSYYVRCVRAGQ